MTTYTEALVEALGTNKWTIAAKVIKEQDLKHRLRSQELSQLTAINEPPADEIACH